MNVGVCVKCDANLLGKFYTVVHKGSLNICESECVLKKTYETII